MKKLLAILGAVGVTATGASVVVACGNHNKEEKINLSSIIIKKDLGKLADAKEDTVKAALLKENPTLKTDEIKLTIPATKAVATANYTVTVEPKPDSKVYQGKVEGITFNTQIEVENTKIKIDSVKAAVGDIAGKENLDAVNIELAGKLSNATEGNVLKNISSLTAAIKTGTQTDVIVKVTAKKGYKLDSDTFEIAGAIVKPTISEGLSEVIKTTDLGTLDNAEEATVIDALVAKNPSLKKDHIKVTISNGVVAKTHEQTTNYTVTVGPKENDDFYNGKVDGITFNTKANIDDEVVSKTTIDNEIAKLNENGKTYNTTQEATDAIKKVETEEFKVSDATLKTDSIRGLSNQVFNITVQAKTGYVLANDIQDGKTTVELKIGTIDVITQQSVLDLVNAKIKGNNVYFENENNLNDALAAIVKPTGVESITGELADGSNDSLETKSVKITVSKKADAQFEANWDGKFTVEDVQIGKIDEVDVTDAIVKIRELGGKDYVDQPALQKAVEEITNKVNKNIVVTLTDITSTFGFKDHKIKVELSSKRSDIKLINNENVELSVRFGSVALISTVLKDNTEITGVQEADVVGVKAAVEAQFTVLAGHIVIADIKEVNPQNYADLTRKYTATVKAIDNDKDYTGSVSINFSIVFEQVDVKNIVDFLINLADNTLTQDQVKSNINQIIKEQQLKDKVTYKITEDQTNPLKITIELLPTSNNIELVNNQVVTKTVVIAESKFSYSIISDKYSN
ncbi:hypothetical protein MENTO_v1c04620 [Mesoplasma entomophilum]|uniref:Lipoprotein n=1 Tax=Mesoplasma entomophilum TaxID=2149 RepID=A0A3S5XZ95_9MOLU|nr:lipoprotein [Mesoplasma entomophilum]ATQ35598.1 hypothetical protein CS528_02395 [Mesoplasma entomophilum]ATZ19567.1 hypothetical protein MENTO_v1c04620 [Mesoplasma entomophilum]